MKDSREHILSAALNLFLQKNFKAVTMREIVEVTGLSKGGFYHYFKSKEEVFEEVIKNFFDTLIIVDFSKYQQDSLLGFYNEFVKESAKKIQCVKAMAIEGNSYSANMYFLIFDAMKMFPHFKLQHAHQQKVELQAWTKIIRTAKLKGEIKSDMTDAQLAKLFVYSGDGIGINCIMADTIDKAQKEVKAMWDGLYNMLKA